MSIESYQKIQQIYHKEVADILSSPHVVIEEKVDGSQFRIQLEPDGTIKCGSVRGLPEWYKKKLYGETTQ